jgi:hypothetical protein
MRAANYDSLVARSSADKKHIPVLDGIHELAIIAVLMRYISYVFPAHGAVHPLVSADSDVRELLGRPVLCAFRILDHRHSDRHQAGRKSAKLVLRKALSPHLPHLLSDPRHRSSWVNKFPQWIKQAVNPHGAAAHLAYVFYLQNFYPLWHHGEYSLPIFGHFGAWRSRISFT